MNSIKEELCAEYIELALRREELYFFLARLYRVEIDDELLRAMQTMRFPTIGDDLLAEGALELSTYLKSGGFHKRTDLAVDFARVFLGAGMSKPEAAFPYESVYTSPDHLVMQDARDSVLALYRSYGLGIVENTNDPEDHLAFELQFMAFLCQKSCKEAQEGNWDAVADTLVAQKDFLDAHLLNWISSFREDIARYASVDFYPAVGKMTEGFLLIDKELIENLLEESRDVCQNDEPDGSASYVGAECA